MIKLYNTLSAKKELLRTNQEKNIKIFVCGPTIYDFVHIGNARTYIVFDTFVKYLRFKGYKVNYLQNITDIEDKIIERAKKEKIGWQKLAKKFERFFLEDMKKIGVNSVTTYERATDYIPEIVKQIQILISKNQAYEIKNSGFYFDISTFPDYGKLAKRTSLNINDAVSRIDESIVKKNQGDFALWKFPSSPHEPSWPTILGPGRPGWHIEDTAITNYYFGPQYDIHGGGIDLKFPHHEAEIAQQESTSGKKPMVKIWMHTGFLKVENKKMSKSLGNFITIRDFLKNYPKEVLRFLVLSTHYSSPINWTPKLINQSIKNTDSLANWYKRLKKIRGQKSTQKIINLKIEEYEKIFFKELADDFNTPQAIAVIFKLFREINRNLDKNYLSQKSIKKVKDFIINADKILGIIPKIKKPKTPDKIKELIKIRENFRRKGEWQKADRIREEIKKLGIIIEDTKNGPISRKL